LSVVESRRLKCATLFLGPARLVNHDCRPNCEFVPLGQNGISFRVIRDVEVGEELTTYYSSNYFGENNESCLCRSCEVKGINGFSRRSPAKPTKEEATMSPKARISRSQATAETTLDENAEQEFVPSPAHQPNRPKRWHNPTTAYNVKRVFKGLLDPEAVLKKKRKECDVMCSVCNYVPDEHKYLAIEMISDDNSEKLTCSRCDRHKRIYGVRWPNRVDSVKQSEQKILMQYRALNSHAKTPLPSKLSLPSQSHCVSS
jgi:hypothetical protein